MTNSLYRPLLPLLIVALLGAFTPDVANHVTSFLGLPGIFWASLMLTLEVTLLCIGLADVHSNFSRRPTKLRAKEAILR